MGLATTCPYFMRSTNERRAGSRTKTTDTRDQGGGQTGPKRRTDGTKTADRRNKKTIRRNRNDIQTDQNDRQTDQNDRQTDQNDRLKDSNDRDESVTQKVGGFTRGTNKFNMDTWAMGVEFLNGPSKFRIILKNDDYHSFEQSYFDSVSM